MAFWSKKPPQDHPAPPENPSRQHGRVAFNKGAKARGIFMGGIRPPRGALRPAPTGCGSEPKAAKWLKTPAFARCLLSFRYLQHR